jgi:hypothetical protein
VPQLLEQIAIDAVIGFLFLFAVVYLVAGWRWSELRDLLLHDAYRSFTIEGDCIPGVAPGVSARLMIRWLSDPDDRRLVLVPEVRPRARRLHGPAVFDRLLVAECEVTHSAVFRAR